MIKSNIEEIMGDYFNLREEREKVEYELKRLRELYSKINFIDYENLETEKSKRYVLENKILELEKRLVDITIANIGIEYYLISLDEYERDILEMRLYKNRSFEYIGNKLYISKSTVSRKFKVILKKLNKVI